MRFRDQKFLAHDPQDLYAIVADVESYPTFLPWCSECTVTHENEDGQWVTMVVSFGKLQESFKSFVSKDADDLTVEAISTEGIFDHMMMKWHLLPVDDGTLVKFIMEFTCRSRVMEAMIRGAFAMAQKRIMASFEQRANEITKKP